MLTEPDDELGNEKLEMGNARSGERGDGRCHNDCINRRYGYV
jgi:hypothetical protein